MNSDKTVNNSFPGGIVLFAKQPGKTSFSSLYTIKHALKTKKVGHTGTLDSFAQGLLVVMTGSHTRLAQRVTAFDKTYEAVLEFGAETDTLDPHGKVIKKTPLPTEEAVITAVNNFVGDLLQAPPLYSAVHVNGKRASDLAREGKQFEINKRPVTVYSAKIVALKYANESQNGNENSKKIKNFDKLVQYAHIEFHVSKGTYIRCLARDIGENCHSSAFLIGLLRTAVGSFKLIDAAGVEFLSPFTIDTVLENCKLKNENNNSPEHNKNQLDKFELQLQEEVVKKLKYMDHSLAKECGFIPITLKQSAETDFFNGKPLFKNFFLENLNQQIYDNVPTSYAVFCENNFFAGVILLKNKTPNKIEKNKLSFKYSFVIPKRL